MEASKSIDDGRIRTGLRAFERVRVQRCARRVS